MVSGHLTSGCIRAASDTNAARSQSPLATNHSPLITNHYPLLTMSRFSAPPLADPVSNYRDYQRQRQMDARRPASGKTASSSCREKFTDANANELVMKLLYLQSENRRKDIHLLHPTRRAAA